MARMNAFDDFVFAGRVQLAAGSVCAGLCATAPVRAIADAIDSVSQPITESVNCTMRGCVTSAGRRRWITTTTR